MDRLPPTVEAMKILEQQTLQGYLLQRDIKEYKEIQKIVKAQIMNNQYTQTIEQHTKQCLNARQIPDEYRGHVPKTELPKRAVAEILEKYKTIQLNFENNYVPQPPIEPKLRLICYLLQGDNNPK